MGSPQFAVLLPALSLLAVDGAGGPIDVVVTAAAPLDGQRLADAMRAYLDEYGIRVESAAPAAPGELRRQLAEARRIGEAVRAMAVVRAQRGDGAGDGRAPIEIEIVDLATEKVLIAEVPRPLRDEDLYRALALKIQAGLRSTLSEAPERLGPRAGLARLVRSGRPPNVDAAAAGVAGDDASGEAPARVSLETGYVLFAFPLAGVQLQGLAIAAAFAPRRWLELALAGAVLDSVRAEGAGVVAAGTVVPLVAAAHLRIARARFEGLFGPAVGLAYVGITPSSTTVTVQAMRHLLPAVGAELEGRMRLRPSAWLYGRVAALGVLLGERYRAEGQVLVDTSRFQASFSAGLGVGLW